MDRGHSQLWCNALPGDGTVMVDKPRDNFAQLFEISGDSSQNRIPAVIFKQI